MQRQGAMLNAEINATPFLDVLLVLLITFLAAMTARKTMDAQLPELCREGCAGTGTSIVLEVLASHSYRLNGRLLDRGELMAALHAAYDARPEKILHVAGHRDVRYQDVLSAMDAARSAGVKVITIPPSETSPAR